MKTPHKQIGAGMGTILFNVGILIFLGFMVSKVGVTYVDNRTVQKTLESLDEVPHITKKSEREITKLLFERFRMNNIKVGPDMIYVDRQSGRITVDVIYEERVPLVSNIDAIVSFENHYEATIR